MKIRKVMILFSMVIIYSGCSPRYVDETPIYSFPPKNTEAEARTTAAGSMETNTPEMEGSKYRTYHEESAVPKSTEPNETNTGYTNTLCTGLAKEIFDATNAERVAAGVEPLIWDDRLAEPAFVRANEIITKFDHVRPDGTKCYVLSDLIWGENIARGPHATGQEFLDHWMASKGHKANILQTQYKTIGVGYTCTDRGDTAVQLFGLN